VFCGGALSPFKTLYDDRFGYPGEFTLLSCGECGHRSLDARFTAEELGRLYTEHYPRSLYSLDNYRPHGEVSPFKSWLDGAGSFAFRRVPQNVRILDIGCGFGETLGYHRARGCEVYAVEADENIRRVAEKFGYNVLVGLFDSSQYKPEFFDYVTMDQVIEHMTDPLQTLRDINGILKPGGHLVIGAPNAEGWGGRLFGALWVSWHIPYHLNFFSRKSMELAAAGSGYDLESVETVTSSDYLHLQWNHLAFRPKPGEKSLFWVPRPGATRTRKLVLRILVMVHRMKINHLVTRFFDGLGIGDNYLFVLRKR
jgi:2-polyprenyl-3-methyl-5-hydroxy-6-metoxy-1,4-benzoquinol methylase